MEERKMNKLEKVQKFMEVNKVVITKIGEKEWKEKRADTKLGLESMIQSIKQLLNLGVLISIEENQLDIIEMHLEILLSYYDERSKKSEKEYCDGK